MIRVLHFVPSLSVGSGVINVIMNYYRKLDREKIQFDFLYHHQSKLNFESEIKSLGGRTEFITKPSINFKYKKELKVFLEKYGDEYKIFHSHNPYITFLFTPMMKKYGINHVIIHSHATKYSDKMVSSLRNRLLKTTIRKSGDKFFACSEAAGRFLYGNKLIRDVVIINNAVDFSGFKYNEEIRNKIREELDIGDSLLIGHVGRFTHQKNHDFLIDIYKKVKELRKNTKLVLVGYGKLEENIKTKIKKIGLEKDVIFLGKIENVNEVLNAMDIFLLPSRFEGLPVVAVEAQISGLPVVLSSKITSEVNLGKCKFLDLNETDEKWAKTIVNSYEANDKDRRIIDINDEGFNINREVKKLEDIYLDL